MKKDPQFYISHIAESISDIEQFIEGYSKADFLSDKKTQSAVINRLGNIGEASTKIPNDFKKAHSEIPWNEMSGARNRLVHGYFSIDPDITWDIIKKDLPKLKAQIQSLKK